MKTRNASIAVMFFLTRTRDLHSGALLSGFLLSGLLLSGCEREGAPDSQDVRTRVQVEANRTTPGWVDAEQRGW